MMDYLDKINDFLSSHANLPDWFCSLVDGSISDREIGLKSGKVFEFDVAYYRERSGNIWISLEIDHCKYPVAEFEFGEIEYFTYSIFAVREALAKKD